MVKEKVSEAGLSYSLEINISAETWNFKTICYMETRTKSGKIDIQGKVNE